MATFKVAAVQTYSELANTKRNLEVVLRNIREAARNGAKLVVFPECMNSGYVWRDGAHALECGDSIPGVFTDAIAKLVKELSVHVAIGLSERDGDKLYNSAALIGPNGLVGKYQKNFLFDFDPFYFTFGTTGYPVFDTPLGKIGMFICADARIPEGARMLALHGAEVLLHITNNTTHEQHEIHEPARANENEVWMVCADKAGREEGLTYPGHSQIIHPDGSTVVQGSQFDREIIYAEIDTDEVAAVRQRGDSLMRQRRPQTYWMLKDPFPALPYAKVASTPVIPESLAALASPAQVCNTDGNPTAALDRALRHGDEAGKENARLIVFPELFLMRLGAKAAEAQESAGLTETTLRQFAPLAQRWGAYYVLNLVEPKDGKLFHTAHVIGPDGKIAERYRKVHLTATESDWATPGEDYKVFQAPFGNVGLMLGQDVCFFEVARILCCMGADVIAMPSSWRTEREPKMFTRERALENKVFVVAANRVDAPIPGESTVVFPNAATSNKAGTRQNDYVFSYLNLAWARDKQIRPGTDLVKNRRPQFYGAITQPIPL
ncbi:MAG: carbon-nitrogen hydrolase family protein [Alphaproteobacteria bacterium]|nr:carbon-nitrogen hydrolase family protein [Alphaproteobacteria bacterium]